jgi:hypothetical protein
LCPEFVPGWAAVHDLLKMIVVLCDNDASSVARLRLLGSGDP